MFFKELIETFKVLVNWDSKFFLGWNLKIRFFLLILIIFYLVINFIIWIFKCNSYIILIISYH